MTTSLKYILVTIIAFIGLFIAPTVFGATLVVDTTNDSDNSGVECSLRDAINAINTGAPVSTCVDTSGDGFGVNDRIHFDIPGAGPHTITALSGLPNLNQPVVIDGTTQAGASCGVQSDFSDRNLLIYLDGDNSVQDALVLRGSEITIQGLEIHNFTFRGINGVNIHSATISCNIFRDLLGVSAIDFDNSHTINISGNYFFENSSQPLGEEEDFYAMYITSSSNISVSENRLIDLYFGSGFVFRGIENLTVSDNYISGVEVEAIQVNDGEDIFVERNVIRYVFEQDGIRFSDVAQGTIANNNISFIEPGAAIQVTSSQDISIIENTLTHIQSLNTQGGAVLSMSGIQGIEIIGNTIHTSESTLGIMTLFLVLNAHIQDNIIEGTTAELGGIAMIGITNIVLESNTITNNNHTLGATLLISILADMLDQFGAPPEEVNQLGVTLTQNTIFNNQGMSFNIFYDEEGILFQGGDISALETAGLNPNDAGDIDEGPNNLQNHPIIRSFTISGNTITITFEADFQA
ncbi:MAG: right-handed parallel beta-helix repeat-containing protein, partial [Candidatus Pacebacteria bacterium]|nr:right-handed parallel beta-helix repeat-containing protein [Candidatus Paceibacterota bacterium]